MSGSDPQRERILAATLTLVAEHGFPSTSIDLVLDRAGVDAAEFGRHFSDLEACFTEVWIGTAEEAQRQMLEGYAAAGNWRDGMRGQAWAFCRFLQADHDRARVAMVATASAPEMIRAERDRRFLLFSQLIHLGSGERSEAAEVPLAQAEAAFGAIWDRVSKLVNADAFDRLPKLVPELMFTVVLPYLGLGAAQAELERGDGDLRRYERGEL
jgi:AcrR family transcriptional regulator